MALLRSTPGGSPEHSHAILTLPDGSAITSVDQNHSHKIVPRGSPSPGVPEGSLGVGWTEGEDGHIHEVRQEAARKARDLRPDQDETLAVMEALRLFRTARDFETESRKKAVESERFYRGEQWEESTKRALEAEDRAALTMNEIEPKIDLLSGYQRQNRTDIKYLPVEEGDQRAVDILNLLARNICDQTNYEYEETCVFDDGLIAGRGFFHIYVNYDRNPFGEIMIEQFPWSDVYLGPHKRTDGKDLEYLIKARWFSEAKLKQMFPQKADELTRDMGTLMGIHPSQEDMELQPKTDGYDYAFSTGAGRPAPLTPDPEMVDIAKKEFLLLEIWRRDYLREPIAIMGDQWVSLAEWTDSEVNSAEQLVDVGSRNIDRFRVTIVASTVLLSDEYNDEYGESFSIVPYYAKKRDDLFWGKVEGAKDPQREINKRHSQIVDILNKHAAYGWFYDGNTFTDNNMEKKFKENSSRPGFTIKVSNINNVPVQVEGIKFPNEIAAMEEISTTKLREIMNINPEMLGINSKAESGLAQIEKKRQGLIGNEYLFDNMNLCKKQIGRILVRLIQRIYTPERILRIVESQGISQEAQIGNAAYTPDRRQEILTLLQTEDFSKYDVAISESAHSPTQRRANFVAWAELAGKGIPVPPMLLVQLSDLDEKDKVIQQMQAEAQAQREMEDKKINAEVEKAQIAAANRTQRMVQ